MMVSMITMPLLNSIKPNIYKNIVVKCSSRSVGELVMVGGRTRKIYAETKIVKPYSIYTIIYNCIQLYSKQMSHLKLEMEK